MKKIEGTGILSSFDERIAGKMFWNFLMKLFRCINFEKHWFTVWKSNGDNGKVFFGMNPKYSLKVFF